MPLQNRVAPDGSLHAVAARGLFMGNRGGRFHDPDTRSLTRRRWASKAWICCVTVFRERHRAVWGESYTELFFLDEVTALAAGHRPCFECRRGDAIGFAEAWAGSHCEPERVRAAAMDIVLHGERTSPAHHALSLPEAIALPDGAIVALAERQFAVRNGELLPWSFDFYGAPAALPETARLTLLTPSSIVNVLRAGYRPVWHESAR
ncbi:MAG TPA: hypothetical protein VLA28_09470 [Afifellaceae bacterium]|nr:hypothetical protein [Afifellaceae bacterium]